MIKQNFIIDELEKQRILNLHESRTKGLYLMEDNVADPTKKESYPPCVQSFGNPVTLPGTSIVGIPGGVSNYNWTGFYFFSNYRVQKPNGGGMDYYFCKGTFPMLGQKQQTTKGNTTTSTGLGGTILKVGSTGDAVKQVQNRVVSGGHGDGQTVGGNANCGKDVNSCDGKYGRGTAEAVKKFQTSAGLKKSDGIVGDETWQQLFGGQAPPAVKKAEPEPTDTTPLSQVN